MQQFIAKSRQVKGSIRNSLIEPFYAVAVGKNPKASGIIEQPSLAEQLLQFAVTS